MADLTRTGLQHLTLDTGHTRVSFRDEIKDEVIEQLRPMTVTGEHLMPWPERCSVRVTVDGPAALVTVFRDQDGMPAPLVTFGVVADEAGADALWAPIGSPNVTRPSAVPWLAVKLEAGVLLAVRSASWLGDFERCWAWAWLEQRKLTAAELFLAEGLTIKLRRVAAWSAARGAGRGSSPPLKRAAPGARRSRTSL